MQDRSRLLESFGNGVALARLRDEVRGMAEAAFVTRFGASFLLLDDRERPADPASAAIETRSVRMLGATSGAPAFVFPVQRKPDSRFDFVAVGRNENNDVYLPDASISRFHAYLRAQGSDMTVQDAGSQNGTHLNGARVPPQREGPAVVVGVGAQIAFGDVRTTYLDAPLLLQIVNNVLR